jgi:Asp-tRNA(Asn)/Glu-tRNA(Gln) amidotransferase A subunit family amidase
VRADEYAGLDATALAAHVAAGEVTAAELLAAARERTAAVNPRLNAVVRLLDGEADERVREPLPGPFAGVPFLLKDLGHDQAGVPTSGGCRALADRPAAEDATVVRRWLDAGLVVFGRTNTPEFGAKGVTEPDLFGPARNPWDPERTPGGSSGGAAAAVAAGIVPVAGASDGGGSIRIPAACCGLFGLKPGRGVVPSGPAHGEGFHGAATDGVISRSVRDTAAMLDVLTGAAPHAPFLPAAPSGPYLDEVGRPPGRLRIGVQVGSTLNPTPHPEAVAAVDDAAALLGELGHEVVQASVGYDDAALAEDFLLPWFVRVATQVAEAGAGYEGSDGFELDTRVMAAIGRATPAVAHEAALQRWHHYVRALSDFHRTHDLLLTPTLARPPLRVGELDTPVAERVGARVVLALRLGAVLPKVGVVRNAVHRNLSWVPYTQLANLTGRPAMSVPLHWTAAGLPLGVQFVAPPGGEGTLLRLAAQLETARPWFDRRPPEPSGRAAVSGAAAGRSGTAAPRPATGGWTS